MKVKLQFGKEDGEEVSSAYAEIDIDCNCPELVDRLITAIRHVVGKNDDRWNEF